MKNVLMGVFILLIALFVLLNLAGNMLLGNVLSQVLGVPVSVGRLNIAKFTSEIGIRDLKIQNPKGFGEKTLASIPEVFVSYNLKDLFNKKVHIKQIRLSLDQITVERSAANQVNLMELPILKASKSKPADDAGAGKPEPAKDSKSAGEPMAIQIDEVVFSLGKARYVDRSGAQPAIKEFPLNVQGASLKNVTDPADVVKQIVLQTLQKVGLNALVPDLGQISTAFGAQASAAVEDMKKGVGDLLGKFKQN